MKRETLALIRSIPHFNRVIQNINNHKFGRLIYRHLSSKLSVKSQQQDAQDTEIVIMGAPVISKTEWKKKKGIELSLRRQRQTLFTAISPSSNQRILNRAQNPTQAQISVIVSIYRPGQLFDSFLGNLMEQSIFESTEIVLILVDPIVSERKLATKFAKSNPNVILEIINTRITIYNAWNLAITKCTSPYITNMNIDDLRSPDSLEAQVKFMQSHPWVDVGYQDFFYLLDRDLDWASVVNVGAKSKSPAVTLTELAWFGINPPHNGPIWKRELHARLGLFDENLRSAGDYEFWMRVVSGGGIFAKMSESTVGYFLNPDGMSTSVDSPSSHEEIEVQKKYRSMIKLKSEILPDISIESSYARHPWDGAEVLTEKILNKLREVY